MALLVGCDPGFNGALALLTDGGDLVDLFDMPIVEVGTKKRISAPLIAAKLRDWKPDYAVIELVGAMPGNGSVSMFNFGYGAGQIEGVCIGCGISVAFVRPQAWKQAIRVTKDKGSSRLMAQRLWPAHAEKFARVMDDGRAEAALIGFAGRAQYQRDAA